MVRFVTGIVLVALILVATAIAFGLIKIEQTRDARIPAVAVTGGTLPSYKADVVKVEVGTKDETVKVPTVDVKKPE